MRTLILAGSFGEAARYARGKALRHYRYASSADSVSNFHAQRVVQLPGFSRRADQHVLRAVAQRVVRRGGEWIEDEYVPPVVELTPTEKLATFTRADWLFGNLPTADELRAVGATDDEVAQVEKVEQIAETVVKPAVEATKARTRRKPKAPVDLPTSAPAKGHRSTDDDPFEA